MPTGPRPASAATDSTRLLSTINDLLGIPSTIKQAFLGNLNSNSYLPTKSGNYFSLCDVGERLKQFNFFVQDEWRIRQNLTMTYGVRWEINAPPTETSDSPYVPNNPINGSAGPVTFVKADSCYTAAQPGCVRSAHRYHLEPWQERQDCGACRLGHGVRPDRYL